MRDGSSAAYPASAWRARLATRLSSVRRVPAGRPATAAIPGIVVSMPSKIDASRDASAGAVSANAAPVHTSVRRT
ncbi:hypothetical protein D3C83_21610 [compost metagenome]